MKKILFFHIVFFLTLFPCLAQVSLAREYSYDAAGNRTSRAVINLSFMPADTIPSDTTFINDLDTPLYYKEFIGEITVNVFPNPTSKKVTISIVNSTDLHSASAVLYTLNGQFLREIAVNNHQIEVDLSNETEGVYLLKFTMNDFSNTWKIIKQ